MKVSLQFLKELNEELKTASSANVKFSRLNNKHLSVRWDNLDVNMTANDKYVLCHLETACNISQGYADISHEIDVLRP